MPAARAPSASLSSAVGTATRPISSPGSFKSKSRAARPKYREPTRVIFIRKELLACVDRGGREYAEFADEGKERACTARAGGTMPRQIIDISVPLANKIPADPP